MAKTREEAVKEVADLLNQVDVLMSRAEDIADEHDIPFSFDGPGYGMGGWYESGEWQASSHSC